MEIQIPSTNKWRVDRDHGNINYVINNYPVSLHKEIFNLNRHNEPFNSNCYYCETLFEPLHINRKQYINNLGEMENIIYVIYRTGDIVFYKINIRPSETPIIFNHLESHISSMSSIFYAILPIEIIKGKIVHSICIHEFPMNEETRGIMLSGYNIKKSVHSVVNLVMSNSLILSDPVYSDIENCIYCLFSHTNIYNQYSFTLMKYNIDNEFFTSYLLYSSPDIIFTHLCVVMGRYELFLVIEEYKIISCSTADNYSLNFDRGINIFDLENIEEDDAYIFRLKCTTSILVTEIWSAHTSNKYIYIFNIETLECLSYINISDQCTKYSCLSYLPDYDSIALLNVFPLSEDKSNLILFQHKLPCSRWQLQLLLGKKLPMELVRKVIWTCYGCYNPY